MNYCVGFIFNKELTRVLLIKKKRGPASMSGKLNGIGGKIEKDESGLDAIIRECREETGLDIQEWVYYCRLECNDGADNVYCYYAVVDSFVQVTRFSEHYTKIKHIYTQKTDEEVCDYHLYSSFEHGDYTLLPHMANLEWLIPMAINHYKKLDAAKSFVVTEVY